MGRKKRVANPWSSSEDAEAACVRELGPEATREGVDAFRAVSAESSGHPTSDEFIPWMADLLSALERKYESRLTGRVATLLWVASAGRPLSSEDRFERSRKNWDEALRRARKKEYFGGPGMYEAPVSRLHRDRVWSARRDAPRSKPSPERVRRILELELEYLREDAQRLSLRELSTLLRRAQRLRESLRSRPRR